MISQVVYLFVLILFGGHIQLARSQYTHPTFANFSGPSGPLVDLGYLKVQGTTVTSLPGKYNAWLGIRYAATPTGQQRFGAATPIEFTVPPNVTFDATSFGPICYQGYSQSASQNTVEPGMLFGNRQPSEDCLLLDIYAPAHPASKQPLPVLLNIHGGGYDLGSSTSTSITSLYELGHGASGHFLLVSIQYRLAAFGFLGGDEVAALGQPNAGLADQRLAMQWVQRHISSFGGDPSKITIQGASAGGGSVAYQYIWQGGEVSPPFRAGISDFTWWQTLPNTTQLAQQYQGVLNAANCSTLNCLRSLSSEEFYNVQQVVLNETWRYPSGIFYFGPYVDGHYIQNLPSLEVQAGHFSKRPLIISHDTNEGLIFTPTIDTQDQFENRVAAVFPAAGPNFRNRINELYPPSTTGLYGYNASVGQQLRSDYFFGDVMVACPTYYLASSLSDAGVSVYKYVYALPTFSTAVHGRLLELFVPTPDNDSSPSATLGRQFFKHYIPNFIMTSDPNDNSWLDGSPTNNAALGNVAEWPAYGAESQILFVNSTATPVLITTDLDATDRCDFLWAHSVQQQV
ncbi:Alpha/Beta hydrolase protein [Aspergillus granulosus]|uniref:Carboxylic ester hydrolase n=1 Tax=Aspergillus granulosus TaxID=176169 RepID=A0ABR4I1U4_9EURO